MRRRLLTDEIDQAVVQAHHLQVSKAEFLRLAEERFDRSSRSATRAAVQDNHDHDTPVIEIHQLVRRYGRTDAVNGLNLRVAARTLLRLLRPERRRQDHDDQVPAESAAPDERDGAGLRSGPGARRSRRQVAARLRPGSPSRSIRG